MISDCPKGRNASAHRRGLWYFQSLAAALLLILPLTVVADYLRVVGPAPLRFEPIPARPTPQSTIAATIPEAPAPANHDSNTLSASNSAIAPPSAVITTAKSPTPFGDELGPDALPWSPPTEPAFASPEMILPFFQNQSSRTNNVGPGVIAPIMFIPPTRLNRPPPSKAVYSSPPADLQPTDDSKK